MSLNTRSLNLEKINCNTGREKSSLVENGGRIAVLLTGAASGF